MTRRYTSAAVLFVGLLAVLVVFSLGGTSAEDGSQAMTTTERATLRITNVSPLAVTGLGFKSGERVRITAESRPKIVFAGTRGRFSVRFAAVDPCNGFIVTAVGNRGSRAALAFNATWRVHCAAP